MLYDVKRNDKVGYINSSGEVVVLIEAKRCIPFADGFGGVFHGHDLDIVDTRGNIVGHCKNVLTGWGVTFSNGLLPVTDRQSGRNGYIDSRGHWVIPPKFSSAFGFANQVAVARPVGSHNCGLIDRNGLWKCDPKYHQIFGFDEETSCTLAFEIIGERRGLRVSLLDKEGHQVGDAIYDSGHGAGEGLIPVSRDSKWGMVNEKAELLIPYAFKELNRFADGIASARGDDGQVGTIDKSGHWRIHPTFDWIDPSSEGLCGAMVNDDRLRRSSWGFIDHDGNWVIAPTFAEAEGFRGGLAAVVPHAAKEGEEFDEWGYIDRDGKYVWEPIC